MVIDIVLREPGAGGDIVPVLQGVRTHGEFKIR